MYYQGTTNRQWLTWQLDITQDGLIWPELGHGINCLNGIRSPQHYPPCMPLCSMATQPIEHCLLHGYTSYPNMVACNRVSEGFILYSLPTSLLFSTPVLQNGCYDLIKCCLVGVKKGVSILVGWGRGVKWERDPHLFIYLIFIFQKIHRYI